MLKRMNNKGFTLIETLTVIVLISIVTIVASQSLGKTLSINKEESYKIMKNNIIKASETYIKECIAGTISCDSIKESNMKFSVKILKEKGYFKNLNSPIDGKDLSNCLIVETKIENGVIISSLQDNCY